MLVESCCCLTIQKDGTQFLMVIGGVIRGDWRCFISWRPTSHSLSHDKIIDHYSRSSHMPTFERFVGVVIDVGVHRGYIIIVMVFGGRVGRG